jgi:hypothetical protein
MNRRLPLFAGMILFIFPGHASFAQIVDKIEIVKLDTNYVKAYRDELTVRTFVAWKQNGYNLSDRMFSPWLRYRTNDNLLLGVGYTYSFLTLNLAAKMPFINADDDLYGKSTYMDLQAHSIFRSFIVDLYLQWNKGYYVSNPGAVIPGWASGDGYPVRGDLRTHIFGLNVQYLFNSSRYSYKASFLQNEFQKRSAGSPIAGVEAYWMLGMSDSLLIGSPIPSSGFLDDHPFNQVDLSNVGVNGGYAYTFVLKEKLYLSLSSVFGISAGYNQVHYSAASNTLQSGITAGWTNSSRISFGFNSKQYYVGFSFIYFHMNNLSPGYGDFFSYDTSSIRFNVVKRFQLKRPIVVLRPDLWIVR